MVSIQSCCEKRSQSIVVWAVWRPLQSLAQLLRWCCWKRRRRGLRDTVSTASISCPTFFSVFDWKRCTPNWHYFGWEGFQYISSPTNVALHLPTHPTDDLAPNHVEDISRTTKTQTAHLSDIISMSAVIPPTDVHRHIVLVVHEWYAVWVYLAPPAPLATGLPGSLPMPLAC